MDRFIESVQGLLYVPVLYLKSNMDRFIVEGWVGKWTPIAIFKIQYG